jgi:hypothetical protein
VLFCDDSCVSAALETLERRESVSVIAMGVDCIELQYVLRYKKKSNHHLCMCDRIMQKKRAKTPT